MAIKDLNPIALRKAKIVCTFGPSECIRVNDHITGKSILSLKKSVTVSPFMAIKDFDDSITGESVLT